MLSHLPRLWSGNQWLANRNSWDPKQTLWISREHSVICDQQVTYRPYSKDFEEEQCSSTQYSQIHNEFRRLVFLGRWCYSSQNVGLNMGKMFGAMNLYPPGHQAPRQCQHGQVTCHMEALVILPGPTIMNKKSEGGDDHAPKILNLWKTFHQGMIIIALSHDIPIHIRPNPIHIRPNPHFQWSPAWIPWNPHFQSEIPMKSPHDIDFSPAPKWQHITSRWLHHPVHGPMPRTKKLSSFWATGHQQKHWFPQLQHFMARCIE